MKGQGQVNLRTFNLVMREKCGEKCGVKCGVKKKMTDIEIAKRIFDERTYDVLEKLHEDYKYNDWTSRCVKEELVGCYGLSPKRAEKVEAVVSFARAVRHGCPKQELEHLGTPAKVADYFMEKLRHQDREVFVSAYLNSKNRLIGERTIGIGSVSSAPVDIQEVFRWGIRYKASGIILVHNHPSGDPAPSTLDIQITKKFIAAAEMLDMKVLDHIIIGDRRFVSMQEDDLL